MTRFVLLAFTISWGFWGALLALASFGTIAADAPARFYAWGGAGPSLAAAILVHREWGGRGLRRLLAWPLHWRARPLWYLVSLLAMAAIAGAALVCHAAAGGRLLPFPPLRVVPLLLAIGLVVGIMEEYGWRGYLLPRLLATRNAAAAALLVGLVWAAWHLPLFWFDGLSFAFWPQAIGWPAAVARYLATTLALSFLMTWVFCRSGANLFVSGFLFHSAANTAGDLFTAAYVRAGILRPSLLASALLSLVGLLVAFALARRPCAPAPPYRAAPPP